MTVWAHGAAVAMGASVGALARWRLGLSVQTQVMGWPLGTLIVNVVGGFAMGMALGLLARSTVLHAFVVTGVLGGFTTFSAFSAESLELLNKGRWLAALFHSAAHVMGALIAAAAGYALVVWFKAGAKA
jgi:fluoride exporter